ncbi:MULTISPECIES: hypothetical protein [unclassified Streptomyces]|uniref:ATP-dependent DNA ligase n=1 Tax=unclassified Streptomyces TaxID=2593676 RepID=UPI00099D5164|nr:MULTISPECIES: hypothetical protein [unclassified Streptomyces]
MSEEPVAETGEVAHINGELVVWEAGRLAFERLQGRLRTRGTGAARLASEWPTHFVAFNLLRLAGTDTTRWPYRRRRAALKELFQERGLTAPWALCPSTTDADTIRQWLTWTAVGVEGKCGGWAGRPGGRRRATAGVVRPGAR